MMNITLKKEISAMRYHRMIFTEMFVQDKITTEYYTLITSHLRAAEIAINELFKQTKQNEYTLRT